MEIICAWCKNWIGQKLPLMDKSITHSICKDCAADVRKQARKFIKENPLHRNAELFGKYDDTTRD